ncbi:MAG: hypothetical protein J5993_04430 [Clostridia bacterium]|nr:hypothetical protein [Clostridia bacterium]
MARVEDKVTLDDLAELCPFLDEDDVAKLAKKILERDSDISELVKIAPFMDEEDLGELVVDAVTSQRIELGEAVKFGAFLEEKTIRKLMKYAIEHGKIKEFAPLAAYL